MWSGLPSITSIGFGSAVSGLPGSYNESVAPSLYALLRNPFSLLTASLSWSSFSSNSFFILSNFCLFFLSCYFLILFSSLLNFLFSLIIGSTLIKFILIFFIRRYLSLTPSSKRRLSFSFHFLFLTFFSFFSLLGFASNFVSLFF